MRKKLLLLVTLGLIGVGIYRQRADIQRYMRLKQM